MRSGAEILLPQGVIRPDFAARPSPETEPRQVIYYAGDSPKRKALLQMLVEAEGKVFTSTPGGPEDNNLDPGQIAAGKIDHAMAYLISNRRIRPNSNTENVFVAADVQVHYPILKPDGKTVSQTSGKPEEIYGVRQLFQGMIESAKARGDKRDHRYLIEAGSASKTILGTQVVRRIEPNPIFFHIALEQQAVDFFATPSGTKLYLDTLNRFLKSSQYLSNGLTLPGSATEICGGLDLAVLERLEAVRKINQTPKESPDFKNELKAALFTAYVGFDLSVLKQINPNAESLVWQWPWLQKITDYALNN